MSGEKILVVDDEPDVVETVKFRLESDGYEVVTAADGFEALGAARVHRPDLILLDVMLPKENGYRVSRLLREDEDATGATRRTPIVLLTARDLSGDAEREKMFMDFSRANLVIYKPFDLAELVEVVERLLAARPQA